MATAVINIDVKSQSLDQLEAKLQALQARIKSVPTGSAEFKKLTAEFQTVQKQVDVTNAKIKGLNIDTLAGNFAKIAGGVGAGFAAANLLVSENEDATKALADAQKTLVTVLATVQVAEALASAASIARTISLGAETAATTVATTREILFTESLNANTVALAANARTRGLAAEALAVEKGIAEDTFKATKDGITVTEQAAAANGKWAVSFGQVGNLLKTLGKNIISFLTSPVGIAVAAIGLLTAAIISLQSQFEKAAQIGQYGQEIDDLEGTIKSVTGSFDKALTTVIAYNAIVSTGTLDANEYALAQQAVSKSLLEAGVSQEEVNRIIADGVISAEEYIAVLQKQITVQVAVEQLKKGIQDLVEFQADATKSAPTFWQTLGNSILSYGDFFGFVMRQTETQLENNQEQTAELTAKIKKSFEIAKNLANDPELKGIFDSLLFGKGGKEDFEKNLKTADDLLEQAQRKLRDAKIKESKDGFDEEEALARTSYQNQVEDARKKNAEIQKDDAYTAAEKAKAERATNIQIQALGKELNLQLKEIGKKRIAQTIDDAKKALDDYSKGVIQVLKVYETTSGQIVTENAIKLQKANEDARAKQLAGDKDAIVKSQEEITIAILELEKTALENETSLAITTYNSRLDKIAQAKKEYDGKTDKASLDRLKELEDEELDLQDEKFLYIEGKNNEIAQKELDIVKAKNDKVEKDNEETQENIAKKEQERLDNLIKAYEAADKLIAAIDQYAQERANRLINKIQVDLETLVNEIDDALKQVDATEKKRIDDLNKSEVLGERAKANAIKQIEEKAERDRQELEKKKEAAQKAAKKKELEVQIKALDIAITAQIGQAIVSAASGIATATAQAPLTFGASLLLIAPIAAALAGAIAAYTQQRGALKDSLNALNFADGGYVSGPGTSRSDSIPANLSNGEFVVNAQSTSRNLPLLQAINSTAGNSSVDMAVILTELKDEIASLKTRPLKTYVVTSDLAAAQQTESYIARRAKI